MSATMRSTLQRPSRGAARAAATLVALAAIGGGLLLMLRGEAGAPAVQSDKAVVTGGGAAPPLPQPVTAQAAPAAAAATAQVAAPACPFQRLEIALAGSARLHTCVDATRVQQNGGVRTYLAAGSGRAGWALQVDVAGGAVIAASLRSGDGRQFGCEAEACAGLSLGRHDARGLRTITLDALELVRRGGPAADDSSARVSGRLTVPADDQLPGLACLGPSVLMNSPDGSAHKFCGQGGAGVEIADDGVRRYRFEDAEGRSLAIAVDAARRVTRIEYGGLACSDPGCTGATMNAPTPDSELSERQFYFGRTPLYASSTRPGVPGRPQLILDGSLTLPSQE